MVGHLSEATRHAHSHAVPVRIAVLSWSEGEIALLWGAAVASLRCLVSDASIRFSLRACVLGESDSGDGRNQ